MGHYNNATICLNGHVVSKYQANYQKFCSKCGKETYSKCPECNSPIHGKYEVDPYEAERRNCGSTGNNSYAD